MITRDSHFHRLFETQKYILGHVFEYAYLVRKKNYKEIYMGGFYGGPECGLIDVDNKWCLVGGNMLTVWTENKGVFEINDEELSWVCKIRQKSAYIAELLIDPWSDKGSVWTLNILTFERHKIQEYKLDGEHCGHIDR